MRFHSLSGRILALGSHIAQVISVLWQCRRRQNLTTIALHSSGRKILNFSLIIMPLCTRVIFISITSVKDGGCGGFHATGRLLSSPTVSKHRYLSISSSVHSKAQLSRSFSRTMTIISEIRRYFWPTQGGSTTLRESWGFNDL